MRANENKPWLDHRGHHRCIDDLIEMSASWNFKDWEKYLKSLEGGREGKSLRSRTFRKISEHQTKSVFDLYAEKSSPTALQKFIEAALEVLSDKQRDVIRLTFFEGLSLDQAAECLNLGKSTVFEHQKSALKKLRVALTVRANDLASYRRVSDFDDEPQTREEEIYEVMQQDIGRDGFGRNNFDRDLP
jgi:RNA polymerase sigma factor (sigma-70 family)